MTDKTVSLAVRVFEVNKDVDAERDREIVVSSVEIEDGTIWIYVEPEQMYDVLVYSSTLRHSGVVIVGDRNLELATLTGEMWLEKYPDDIVMLVEV